MALYWKFEIGFDVSSSAEQKFLNVKIPTFRHDIDNSHDICEEIADKMQVILDSLKDKLNLEIRWRL